MLIFQIKIIISSEKWFNCFFFENTKNLGRSDDAKRRKKRGWPYIQNWSCELENRSTNSFHHLSSWRYVLILLGKKIVAEKSWQPCILSVSAVERTKCVSLVGHVLYWNKWTDYWNKRALNFYHSLGCVCLEKFRSYRLNGERLLDLAGKKSML